MTKFEIDLTEQDIYIDLNYGKSFFEKILPNSKINVLKEESQKHLMNVDDERAYTNAGTER